MANKRSRPHRSSRRRRDPKEPVRLSKRAKPLPAELKKAVVLLDQEDYYGIYLDLVLFNLAQPEAIKVSNSDLYSQFKKLLIEDKVADNIYLVDETYGWGVLDIAEVIGLIREHDKKAFIIGMTAMLKDDVLNPELYDEVTVKSRGMRDDNVIFLLAQKLKLDFVESNADPSYTGHKVMQKLIEQGDDFPQKIYRDAGNTEEGTLL